MSTVSIRTTSSYTQGVLGAIFKVYGYDVLNNKDIGYHDIMSDRAEADIVIIELPFNEDVIPNVQATIYAVITSSEYMRRKCPAHALFYLKPVDLEIMAEFIIDNADQFSTV